MMMTGIESSRFRSSCKSAAPSHLRHLQICQHNINGRGKQAPPTRALHCRRDEVRTHAAGSVRGCASSFLHRLQSIDGACSWFVRFDGKVNRECCSGITRRETNVSLNALHHHIDDGEPESSAGWLCSEEWVEYLRLVFRSNAGTGVFHGDDDRLVSLSPGRELQLAAMMIASMAFDQDSSTPSMCSAMVIISGSVESIRLDMNCFLGTIWVRVKQSPVNDFCN